MRFAGYALRTAAEDLDEVMRAADAASERVWPAFLLHSAVANEHWPQLWTRFPEYQYALVDEAADAVVAVGHSIPLAWSGDIEDLPDEGWAWAISNAMQADDAPRDTMSALAIIVLPEHQGRGIGRAMVEAMREIGRRRRHSRLVVPLRRI